MNESELIDILVCLGWCDGRDDVGEVFLTRDIGGVLVQILPHIAKRPDHYRFSLNPSVSTNDFSVAASYISGERFRFEPIIVGIDIPKKIHEISTRFVQESSDQVVSWVRNQNIDQGLEVLRNLPTDSKGAFPLRHLAALGVAGDVEKLRSYERCFREGDRCGFVPYITDKVIARALVVGDEHNVTCNCSKPS